MSIFECYLRRLWFNYTWSWN